MAAESLMTMKHQHIRLNKCDPLTHRRLARAQLLMSHARSGMDQRT
jgi:hypothetical protein